MTVALKKLCSTTDLKIGLKANTPWDGKKWDTTKNDHFKQRIQAVKLECEGKHTAITEKVIKDVFAPPSSNTGTNVMGG